MNNKNQGSRYEETKNLDIKEIAKLVRKDIKKSFTKDFKFLIKIKRFSGGQSLDIIIKEAPKNYLNVDKVRNEYSDEYVYTPEGFEILDKIKKIVDEYNYDNSDCQIDYFDTKFYTHVNFDYDLMEKWRKEIQEMLK